MTTPTQHAQARAQQNDQTAAAWSFVMQHEETITRHASNVARDSHVNPDDLRQEVILQVVERFSEYSAERGKATTWIYWMARRCATADFRQRGAIKRGAQVLATMSVEDLANWLASGSRQSRDVESTVYGDRGATASRMEASAQLAVFLPQVEPEQLQAVVAKMECWSSSDIFRAMGVSRTARDGRLARMRDNLGLG